MALRDLLNKVDDWMVPGKGKLSNSSVGKYVQSGQAPQFANRQTNFKLNNPSSYAPTAGNFAIQNIVNPFIKTAGNTFLDATNQAATLAGTGKQVQYNQLRSGISKLGYQSSNFNPFIAQSARNERQTSFKPQEVLANVGETGSFVSNFFAPGVAKGLALSKSALLPTIRAGAVQGAKFGAGFGGLSGLEQGRNQSLLGQLGTAGQSAVVGGALRGLLGAGAPVAGRAGSGAKNIVFGKKTAPNVQQAFQVHVDEVAQRIEQTPGLRNQFEARLNAVKGNTAGSTTVLRKIAADMQLPNTGNMNHSELKQYIGAALGKRAKINGGFASKIIKKIKSEDGHIGIKQEGQQVGIGDGYSAPKVQIKQPKEISVLRKSFDRTRNIISQQGEAGKMLAGNLQAQRDLAETTAGQWVSRMNTVRNLSKQEFDNFVDAAEGKAAPSNPKVSQAVQEWSAIRDEIADAGQEVLDMGRRENYFPHVFDQGQFKKDWSKNIRHLIETGQAVDESDAAQKLNFFRDTIRNRKHSNLENERVVDLPGYKRDKEALLGYIESAANRISEANVFGAKDEKSLELIGRISQEGFDADSAKRAYDIAVGAKTYDPTAKKLSGDLRGIQSLTKLGLGAITNLGQTVNTATVTGFSSTAKAIAKTMKDPQARDFALKTGATLDGVLSDVREGTGFSGKVLGKITAPGFNKVEQFNRTVAVHAGAEFAKDMARKGNKKALAALGIPNAGKELTEVELITAARKIVERTQFKVDAQDLPGWTASPFGKIVSQFKTFSYNQSAFVYNEMIKAAKDGNVQPLLRFLVAAPVVGAATLETQNVLRNRKSEEDPTKRMIGYYKKAGGLGLAGDVYESLFQPNASYLPPEQKTARAAASFLGPTIGTAMDTWTGVQAAIDGKPNKLGRTALNQVPLVGGTLANTLLPYRRDDGTPNRRFGNGASPQTSQVAGASTQSTSLSASQRSQIQTQISALKKQEKEILGKDENGIFGIGGTPATEKNSQVASITSQRETLEKQLDRANLMDKASQLSTRKGTGVLSTTKLQKDKDEMATKLYNLYLDGEMTDKEIAPMLSKLGVKDLQKLEYRVAAGLPDEEQAQYVMESMGQGGDLNALIDNKVLTKSVAKQMYDQGLISSDEYDQLKNMIKGKTSTGRKSNRKGRKAKAIKITMPKTNPLFTQAMKGGKSPVKPIKFQAPPEVNLKLN